MIILVLSSSRCIISAIVFVFVRIRHMNIRELNNPLLMRQNVMTALHVSTACQGLLEAPASRPDVDEGNTPQTGRVLSRKPLIHQQMNEYAQVPPG